MKMCKECIDSTLGSVLKIDCVDFDSVLDHLQRELPILQGWMCRGEEKGMPFLPRISSGNGDAQYLQFFNTMEHGIASMCLAPYLHPTIENLMGDFFFYERRFYEGRMSPAPLHLADCAMREGFYTIVRELMEKCEEAGTHAAQHMPTFALAFGADKKTVCALCIMRAAEDSFVEVTPFWCIQGRTLWKASLRPLGSQGEGVCSDSLLSRALMNWVSEDVALQMFFNDRQ
jgi:hypothetical protein